MTLGSVGQDPAGADATLTVSDLQISVSKPRPLALVDTASLRLPLGGSLGVVGESGSGKSMLCRALIGTLGRYGASITAGTAMFGGVDLVRADRKQWRRIRGRRIGYVPQSSLAGLNPVLTVGATMHEAVTADESLGRAAAKQEAIRYLDLVQLPNVEGLLRKRPHELSGGMRQRVMIAAALAQKPAILLADEPTTALDVSVQSEILTLLRELRRELGMSLILVSHDIAVVEEVCDEILVMYAGATVESGRQAVTAQAPLHPYTKALLQSRIDLAPPGEDLRSIDGEPPLAGSWPAGCRFWPRCPIAQDDCKVGTQPRMSDFGGRLSACLHTEVGVVGVH